MSKWFGPAALTPVAAAALCAAAMAAESAPSPPIDVGPGPVTFVPERAVGPIRLGAKRSAIEDRFGPGERESASVVDYRYRNVKLVVSYNERNHVRDVAGSGGKLVAYGQRLSNVTEASKVLHDHGWEILQCDPGRRLARRIRGDSFSTVVWDAGKPVVARVSHVSVGLCLIGLPVGGP